MSLGSQKNKGRNILLGKFLKNGFILCGDPTNCVFLIFSLLLTIFYGAIIQMPNIMCPFEIQLISLQHYGTNRIFLAQLVQKLWQNEDDKCNGCRAILLLLVF